MKYRVRVQRSYKKFADIVVEAENEDEAGNMVEGSLDPEIMKELDETFGNAELEEDDEEVIDVEEVP